ncbi:hypothetical protein NH621_10305 [Lactococcus formosensis]|nr:hypothetical protein [Lactococcus formosensis]MCO7181555.1 hypothetical protein [Lactococcus formosensis]
MLKEQETLRLKAEQEKVQAANEAELMKKAIAEENKVLRFEGQKEFEKAKKETELYITQKQEEAEAIVKAAEEKGQEKLIEAEEQLAELNNQILETRNAAKELIGRLGELMKLGI